MLLQVNDLNLSNQTLDDLLARVREYMPSDDLTSLTRAYQYAEKIHSGKLRFSGESYITHPLAIAHILAGMRLDLPTIISGLLHGVLKETDTPSTEQELHKLFGKEVARIVGGATRITDVRYNSKLEYQAENLRKMFLAMSSDIRVLLVKLADRLHDMRTLSFTKKRQKEIARETLEVYAPLASRLGIDWMKRELEDLAFAFLFPEEYQDLAGRITTSLNDRERYVDEVKEILSIKLQEAGLSDFRILGRPKHLYSIYKKLLAQKIPLEKVYDKVAFRIIVKKISECYEVLGVVHSQWQPISGRFKDFISTPKSNMYQSLHTSVVGPRAEFMEVQIRTEEMDAIAKEGIAAHWAYKEGRAISQKDARLFKWLKQLIQNLKELKDPQEFLDAVKDELYEIEVYALTPNGDVKEFPYGSTPLDFAYYIHTEVGNHCAGAKVNNKMVPLRYQLKNGDVVEILTAPNKHPNRGWLNLAKSSRARSRIRQWLKQQEQEKMLHLGREICERELRKHDISLKKLINTGHFREILKALSCNTLDDLLWKVGCGKTTVQHILNKLEPKEIREEKESAAPIAVHPKGGKRRNDDVITIDGVDGGILTAMGRCCLPVPGDEIAGYVTAGRGVAIHKSSCANLLATDPERRINVAWTARPQIQHQAYIQVLGQDKKGLLATLSQTISGDDANIIHLEAKSTKNGLARLDIMLEISGIDHLQRILQHIKQLDGILEASRKR